MSAKALLTTPLLFPLPLPFLYLCVSYVPCSLRGALRMPLKNWQVYKMFVIIFAKTLTLESIVKTAVFKTIIDKTYRNRWCTLYNVHTVKIFLFYVHIYIYISIKANLWIPCWKLVYMYTGFWQGIMKRPIPHFV